MDKIRNKLFELQDIKYKDLQVKIIPNIDSENIIGVRTPLLRNYAKELINNNEYKDFLNDLPHKYFDENQLHAFIVSVDIKQISYIVMHSLIKWFAQ